MSLDIPHDRRSERIVRWILSATIAVLALVMTRSLWKELLPGSSHNETAEPRPIVARGSLAEEEKTAIEIFERASPSVVYVTTLAEAYVRDFLSIRTIVVPEGTGSGFVWDEQGHIVTNYHVVRSVREQGRTCKVTLKDQSTWNAKLVGIAKDKDLAVLRIDAPLAKLQPLLLGTSHDLKVGQTVFAIGNPFGYDQTLTKGIVSYLGREIEALNGQLIKDVIQTDAAINPGNSGGPLLDSAGRLIGVNTAARGDAENIGFAIPVDTVNDVVPQTIQFGGFRPGLGIRYVETWRARRAGFNSGVIVEQAIPKSTAANAGIRGLQYRPDGRVVALGDIILAVNDVAVNSDEELTRALGKFKVGDTVNLRVQRGEEKVVVPVELQPMEEP